MGKTWIVAADAIRARILELDAENRKLVELEDLTNPEGRMQDRELQSDAEPRFNAHKARTQHRFDALMLVAPPKFLGALRSELDKEV